MLAAELENLIDRLDSAGADTTRVTTGELLLSIVTLISVAIGVTLGLERSGISLALDRDTAQLLAIMLTACGTGLAAFFFHLRRRIELSEIRSVRRQLLRLERRQSSERKSDAAMSEVSQLPLDEGFFEKEAHEAERPTTSRS